ncbi:acyl-CoA thioesterase [Maribacter sp. IgM3_T14_3]|uniref:acyl-CoA thioesterase n=1 Tax=Maribacter sp. IgM3_T14_3 TaxID=3415140 RepID=UPI003C6ED928
MNFYTRKWIKPEDLNPNHTLFGGRLLQWIDEEAALFSIIQLDNDRVVTKYITEINFKASARSGDIVEIVLCILKFGKTSVTLKCEVRNIQSQEIIITIDNIVMVNLDKYGNSLPHGKTETTVKLK